jgi:hypothetical protein
MRKFLTSGRRRYALAFVVVGASLGVMGAQCQPSKTPPPPATGLSISPKVGDFGSQQNNGGPYGPIRFVVTNNGPGDTGALDVQDPGDPFDVVPAPDDCKGQTLGDGESCNVDVTFSPVAAAGYLQSLVVDDPSNGEVTATLGGVGIL